MPNLLAYVVLFAWPIIVILLFSRQRPERAFTISILAGYLLIPTGVSIDLPLLPAMDKVNITNLAILFGVSGKIRLRSIFFTPDRTINLLIILGIVGLFITSSQNTTPIIYETRRLSSLSLYDAFSGSINTLLKLVPFLVARHLLATEKAKLEFLVALAVSAALYTLPMLLEIRLSPHLNKWIYGFFPHDWQQQKRQGGFRPVVFLGHGLLVAIFLAMGLVATAYLSRLKTNMKPRFIQTPLVIYLFFVLILSKTLGALILGTFGALVARFLSLRLIAKVALALSMLAFFYPALRYADLIPTNTITNIISSIDEARAGSLQFRFDNEDMLLAKAQEKSITGWGGWGRNRVFDSRGRDIAVTDGYWVIIFGMYGWIGYISTFGLLTLGAYRAYKLINIQQTPEKISPTIMMALILSINMIDLLPNSSTSPILWLLAGALTGTTLRRQ